MLFTVCFKHAFILSKHIFTFLKHTFTVSHMHLTSGCDSATPTWNHRGSSPSGGQRAGYLLAYVHQPPHNASSRLVRRSCLIKGHRTRTWGIGFKTPRPVTDLPNIVSCRDSAQHECTQRLISPCRKDFNVCNLTCLLYTSPSPRD